MENSVILATHPRVIPYKRRCFESL